MSNLEYLNYSLVLLVKLPNKKDKKALLKRLIKITTLSQSMKLIAMLLRLLI